MLSSSLTSVLTKAMSDLLTELATGKYDAQVAEVENLMKALPGAGIEIERALEIFLWINRHTAPAGKIVPDGQGGWVPETNSKVGPDGEFL